MKKSRRLKPKELTGSHFAEGVAAAKEGKRAYDCPYPIGANRSEWLAGFLAVRQSLERPGIIADTGGEPALPTPMLSGDL
jgi:hypothetical protein